MRGYDDWLLHNWVLINIKLWNLYDKCAKQGDIVHPCQSSILTSWFCLLLSSHKQVPGVTDLGLKPRRIKKVAILGGGLMGSGIATALLRSGYPVILKEVNDKFLQAGLGRVKGKAIVLCWYDSLYLLWPVTNTVIPQPICKAVSRKGKWVKRSLKKLSPYSRVLWIMKVLEMWTWSLRLVFSL